MTPFSLAPVIAPTLRTITTITAVAMSSATVTNAVTATSPPSSRSSLHRWDMADMIVRGDEGSHGRIDDYQAMVALNVGDTCAAEGVRLTPVGVTRIPRRDDARAPPNGQRCSGGADEYRRRR